ncbi:hypothetical protein Phum_PHUM476120 [Pediculus humanus corporis]|uniref:Uncharacterized protein n=1 Tax=Pediculus humanus subsp. corporis TaxID=121224 RepID=E0VW93_PEDHC|nr:uncharacterized protein Phum_PHUM476120 [Pediculus humanus corporis]EEB17649.1 hypothetical protein Phum_PHUM476120 [Pediculus humanus corporis]
MEESVGWNPTLYIRINIHSERDVKRKRKTLRGKTYRRQRNQTVKNKNKITCHKFYRGLRLNENRSMDCTLNC